ncbi:MAG: ribonucleoside triphosphate reductase, partial [Clostridia bacterium]|nr:ribonucleoside triphosphate reductase [Clostridia bacterium]
MLNVKKRDGQIVPFDLAKIKIAIQKAFDSVNRAYTDDMLDMIALKVCADFQNKVKDNCVTVEDIQDSVEVVLIQASFVD